MAEPVLKKIEIEAELLEQAARLGIDVTGVDERSLRLYLQKVDPAGAEARARRWATENAEAIRLHNERIDRYGVFGEDLRSW
ncbi:MAG: type II toxin-antitoxin system CcdA family antitoxin [Brevundimonas sp.]|uniref:type II toxin-antitoxin system CcdA family antitoxin n=1 Tax=Brevundimonas sp. TaxID=1871086 RepID=UPI00273478A3|nr:type II toxin-antitoxin system CcdA family antitoxin [Brevundimonas sp.]MDP3403865.1 type II toxin-antitoxin system CcdA family antitoxin [Brevundimonas sp.]